MSQAATASQDPKLGAGPNAGATAVAMTPEQRKEHDRQVFRRLQAEAEGQPAPTNGEPQRAAQAPAAQAPAPPAPQASAGPSQGQASNQAKPDDADRRELEVVADSVFKRDGLSDKARKALIAGMTPEELRADVDKRRKVQADTDRLGNEAAELKRRLNPGATQGKGDKGAQAGAQDDLAGLSQRQRAIVEKLRKEGDDDRANETLAAFREAMPPRDGPNQQPGQQRPAARAEDGSMPKAVEDQALVAFRDPLDQLARAYPVLNDEGERRKLVNRADRLLRSNALDLPSDRRLSDVEMREVFTKAAAVQYGPSNDPTAAQRALIDANVRERNGQPANLESTPGKPAQMTPKERDRMAFRLLQEGKMSPEQIQRQLASVT